METITEHYGEHIAPALDRIDALRKAKQTGYLRHTVISSTVDRYGRIDSIVLDWLVVRAVNPALASNPVATVRGTIGSNPVATIRGTVGNN